MEWSLSQNKLLAFHRLMRTDKPIGALLLLWPTLWALWVASPGVPPLWILAVFVAGVWLMRAAAEAIFFGLPMESTTTTASTSIASTEAGMVGKSTRQSVTTTT